MRSQSMSAFVISRSHEQKNRLSVADYLVSFKIMNDLGEYGRVLLFTGETEAHGKFGIGDPALPSIISDDFWNEEAAIEYGIERIENNREEPLEVIPGDLRSKSEILTTANVSEADVNSAIANWKDSPPLPEFENILESEVVDE